MSRTPEYFQRQKDALFRKHPDLREFRIITIKEAGWDHRMASDFIESCWQSYYRPEESRTVFSPEFLEWQSPELDGICVLGSDRSKVAGCLLIFPRFYRRQNGTVARSFTFGSCLSILPELRGRGIAQLIVLAVQELDLENSRSFSCCYFDQRKNGLGSSFQLWGTRRSRASSLMQIPLLAKSFDWRKAREYGQLNLLETVVIRGAQMLFPSRRVQSFSKGYRFEVGVQIHRPAVLDLLDAADRGLPVRRVYADEELSRMIAFGKNGFHALSYLLLDRNGCAHAFLYGYRFPLGTRDHAFVADGIVFRPGLFCRLRRSFLSECEGRLRDEAGCVGVTLLSTASRESFLKYGYVPFDSQILGVDLYAGADLSPEDLRDLRIELR
jgi:hypothetical protein